MRRNYRIGATELDEQLQAKRKETAVIEHLHSSGAHLQQHKYTLAADTGARNRTTAHTLEYNCCIWSRVLNMKFKFRL
jgi:hypothetical protein